MTTYGFRTIGTTARPLDIDAALLQIDSDNLEVETTDPQARTQMWHKTANSILRLGASSADGDGSSAVSESIVSYGANSSGTMDAQNVAYARIKPNRFQLFNMHSVDSPFGVSFFRVDPTSLFLAGNTGTKTFEVVRTTGAVDINAGTVDGTIIGQNSPRAAIGTVLRASTGVVGQCTVNTAGSSASPTAAQMIGGYLYHGAAGASVAFTLPGADAIQTALAAVGITTASAMCLPDTWISVTDGNDLTVTAGTGETVTALTGTAVVNNERVILRYVFSGAATATGYLLRTV